MKQKAITLKNSNIFHNTEFSLIIITAVLFAIFALGTHNFMSTYNLTNLFKQCSIIGVIAVASTFVIISGGIDLSVGSITGMSSLFTALLMVQGKLPVSVSIILAILSGVICGLYNGIIINEFKVPPLIATLGSMTIIRGLIAVISNAKTIAGINPAFSSFSNKTTLFIPNLAWIWIIIVLIGYFILKFTRFGRNIYVIGSGQEVAKLSGINIRLNTYAIYSFAGLICGIAGVMFTSRINSSVPTGGSGYELSAIAASVLGGGSLSGGKGTVWGAVLGTFLMTLINNGGIQFGINPFIMDISTGVLITLAVIIDQMRNRRG